MIIGLVAVAVVVIVIFAAVMLTSGTKPNENNNETENGCKDYTPTGDFLKYKLTRGGDNTTDFETYEILGSNETSIYYRVMSTYDCTWSYQNESKNMTWFAGNLTVRYPAPWYDVTHLGKETIDTKWGARSTDHYQTSNGDEYWLLNGVVMKFQLGSGGSQFVLVDTNLPQITDANYGENNNEPAQPPMVTLALDSINNRIIVSISQATEIGEFKISNGTTTVALGTDLVSGSGGNTMTFRFIDAGGDGNLTTGDYFTMTSAGTGASGSFNILWVNGDTSDIVATISF